MTPQHRLRHVMTTMSSSPLPSSSGVAGASPSSSMAQPQASLNLRIGTLSLPGASPAHAARIGDAMRRELATLLAAPAGSGFDSSQHHARIDAGSLKLAATDRPEAIGRRLARAIALGLQQAGAPLPGDAS